ncbi:alpha/beta hydrolase [Enterovibrio sp. ZSDZ35]|uniref:Alpha/beta hydrolase n=1 Tax=Enterovibrio qingdaonensis TaxID=2899818 RepID=A0ABT5QIB1_9GAMM|nr:alpha/beta hydrolase [Enterovibrio sp. ZSDZ35]MDD1780061.1 alpha/beta hydrolase [Enterovibrio sp. ZSDZ35]
MWRLRNVGILLITMLGLQTACAETPKALTELPVPIKQGGNSSSPIRVIFIHGSPGSKEAYDDYLQHHALQLLDLVSVDRLGFGESGSDVETSLHRQAEAIVPLLENSEKRTFLVGHSLGGPIALQVALLVPEKVSGLLLIASAFDPVLEDPKWYNYLADTMVAKWVLPEDMNRSNEEMMVLEGELEKLSEQNWETLNMPIVLVHGEEDDIADPRNSVFAKQKLDGAELKLLPNEGHFVLWQNVTILVNEINALINQSLTYQEEQPKTGM